MDKGGQESLFGSTVVLTLVSGGFIALLFYILRLLKADNGNNVVELGKNETATLEAEKKKEPVTSTQRSKKKQHSWTGRSDRQFYSHPWLSTTLKGHTGQVLDMDFSSNGKYLASCAEDRTVLLWDTKDLAHNDHKSLRINIEFDYATLVKWSPDSKAFIINKFNENALEVYKVERKKESWLGPVTKTVTFSKVHEVDVIGMGIACTGKFMMSCSNKTDLVVWDLKGQELAKVDTYLMNTICAKISPCGRFIAASGFAPDVKIWEVKFSKTGEFQEVKRAFELSGHSSGIYDVAFDPDTSHIATVSKDGTWKLFDVKIEYAKGELPRMKISGKYEQSALNSKIALSPNAEVVAISSANNVYFYSTATGELDAAIENVFSGHVTSLMFDSLGKYLLAAGDKQIRVFHNVTGYKCEIETAKEKLRQNQTSATKERLQKLVVNNEKFLNNIIPIQS